MLTQKQIDSLKAPFPKEALKPEMSRGFELTSIKAAYIFERLNDVFGPVGYGWRYVHSPFETLVTVGEKTEIMTEVALQYRVSDKEQAGCGPIEWHDEAWRIRPDHPWVWSEPIYAAGGKGIGKGSVPYTDARKSAVTDGLTKAASMLGVGHRVFKGLVRSGGNGHHKGNGGGKANATAFWTLYNSRAKKLGVPIETAKDLAGREDWEYAIEQLQEMIAQPAAD